jgi:hypothetical protein
MALDFRTLQAGLSKLTPPSKYVCRLLCLYMSASVSSEWLRRCRPNPAFVENYIKAFYEEDIAAWTSQHPEYSSRQLTALVQLKKKSLFPF